MAWWGRGSRIRFERPRWFWVGIAAVTGGVLLHLPMFFSARHDHYMLSGMGWDVPMGVGMTLIAAGAIAVVIGLAPRFERRDRAWANELGVQSIDEGRLRPAHYRLIAALIVAIAIDTQKPFTFTFILPGVAKEYGLSSPAHPAAGQLPVAILPFFGILGTVIGSFLWGYLGDRVGRRNTILFSGVMFVGTAACGAMPALHWNCLMCFLMGIGVGGLLPIAYSLLTEVVPARQRGAIVVLVAGAGTAAGFLLTSWLAHWLIPTFGWRIMWLIGLPTGLLFLALSNEVPESPRFLLAHGRADEASDVMRRFGIRLLEAPRPIDAAATVVPRSPGVFSRPFTRISIALVVYGVAWGLVNFGFLVWLPLDVSASGIDPGTVTDILAKAALFALPGSLVVAWLYGRWSSKGTMVLAAALTAASLAVFVATGASIARHSVLFTMLVVFLLVSMWAVISVLSPYSAEVYPTATRATGAGLAAGASKLGSVVALSIAVAEVAPPDVRGAALLAAAPMALAAATLLAVGIETRGRRLEEIRHRVTPPQVVRASRAHARS